MVIDSMARKQQHILLVTFPAQSHVNPALHLAKRLAGTTGSLVTFSTTISGHRRMFPSAPDSTAPAEDAALLSYIPFSDGYDEPGTKFGPDFLCKLKLVGTQSLTAIAADLAARGRPVTCIVYTIFLPWVADLARRLSIPSSLYWIQPATVFVVYYHYFHGYDGLVSAHINDPSFLVSLPGLPPLRIRDLPSFITASPGDEGVSSSDVMFNTFREHFDYLDREEGRARVLVNSLGQAEEEALAAVEKLNLIPVGPMVPLEGEWSSVGDLTKHEEREYMEWLDGKEDGTVVYVSFGTFAVLERREVEEIRRGLKQSGRPYLWVLRKDSRWEGMEMEEKGMMVEWCSQVRVLSHRAVGCFVTHCGWNSTLESMACGVPTVGMPRWGDQPTNAWLAAEAWGKAARAEAGGDGVVEGEELRRCLEVVMSEGDKGVEIRRRAAMWRVTAREALHDGGPSNRNLRILVQDL